ncbi:MAG: redoxin domain-containing protein [Phycisphaerae bacterium]|nr:redoxin domain-containing protein [Phycisphaerae bacterium]
MLSDRRIALFGVISAFLVLLGCLSIILLGGVRPGDLRAALPGSKAPEIASRDVDNQYVTLAGLRGSCVLLYFAPDPHLITATNSDDSSSSNFTLDSDTEDAPASEPSDQECLTKLARALDARELTVFEYNRSGTPTAASAEDAMKNSTRILYDSDGDIARRFKVDQFATRSTLFVIDSRGMIRYRGRCARASAEELSKDLGLSSASPAIGKSTSLNASMIAPISLADRF